MQIMFGLYRANESRGGTPRAAALLAAALLTVLGVSAPAARAQDTITFGAALSLTGKVSTEGRLVKEGYDLYVKYINEKGGIKVGDKTYKVAIKYYDDQSDGGTSAKLYEKFITEDGIKLLLGPYSSGVTFAASAVAEKHRVPMVVAHAAAPAVYDRGYKYLFGTLTPIDHYTADMIKLAATATPRGQRVALLNENALAMQQGIDAAAGQARAAGLEVVYKEAYPSGTKDFTPIIAAIKSKNPDVLIAGGYTGDMIVLTRQVAEQDLKLKMLGFVLGPTLPGFIESLGSKADYVLEPIQWASNMPWKDEIFGWTAPQFAEICKKETGHVCDYHPPQSAAALEVYQRALEKAGTTDPQRVRDAIAQTDLRSFYGPVRFNEKGQNIAKGMSVVQIQNGKPVVVYPLEGAEGKLIYPIPAR
jgi:branched-chain amino acid transport system substrate-binding protein